MTVLAVAGLVASQCTSPRSISLCCQSLQPFSANAYVWNNICGVYVSDESILVGSRCDINFPWWVKHIDLVHVSLMLLPGSDAPQYEGFYAVCCSSYLSKHIYLMGYLPSKMFADPLLYHIDCSGDTDGAAGLNCTLVGTEVEPE